MADYIGSKCLACSQIFTQDDDIVVCPDCGTPYHRHCYEENGTCINNELHESNESWKSEKGNDFDMYDEVKCSNCGESNPSTGIFCINCGTPLSSEHTNNSSQRFDDESFQNVPPFMQGSFFKVDNQAEIGGVKIKEITDYVGPNSLYYIPNFLKFNKFGSKFSVNISAMVFPHLYFFYRKMNLLGVIALITQTIGFILTLYLNVENGLFAGTPLEAVLTLPISSFSIESLQLFASILSYASMFIFGCFGNYFYYKKVLSSIKKIQSENVAEQISSQIIREKGGVSKMGLIMSIVIPYVLGLTLIIIL